MCSLHWGQVSFRVFNLISHTLIVLPPQANKWRVMSIIKYVHSDYISGVEKVTMGWVCGPSGLMQPRPGTGHHFLPVLHFPHSNGEGGQ